MDRVKPVQPKGPIPVKELVERLIRRAPDQPPKIDGTVRATRKVFPPVVPQYGAVIAGRLASHGAGRPPQMGRPSYFVKVLTTDGLKTLWGSDLKRAVAESETQPKLGSVVGVQRVGYQVLKLPDGREFRRTRWRVERVEFFAERLRRAHESREARFRGRNTARGLPAQRTVSINLERAQAFADRHIHNPHDRERFLQQVKDKLRSGSLATPSDARPSDKNYEPPAR